MYSLDQNVHAKLEEAGHKAWDIWATARARQALLMSQGPHLVSRGKPLKGFSRGVTVSDLYLSKIKLSDCCELPDKMVYKYS